VPNNARRKLRGSIGYFRRGVCTGEEQFSITVEADGTRLLRAQCEMFDDELLRDVTYAVDANYRPLDAHIRLTQHDRFVGSSWFRFGAGFAECEGFTAREGRFSQRLAWAGWPPCFGTHSLITDAWHAVFWRGVPVRMRSPVSSSAANGGTGPLLAETEFLLEKVCEQRLRAPAGEFDCTQFAITFGAYPPLHFWASGADLQLVRMEWAYLDAYYELLTLEASAAK
jgi:hypothetical protein